MYDLRMRGKLQVWSEYYNQIGIYQTLELLRYHQRHSSCFVKFPLVHTSLFMSHVISFSLHFIDHVNFISVSLQSISFILSTIVHLIYIYLIWLHSYYVIIQYYCQFHFSVNPISGNERPNHFS